MTDDIDSSDFPAAAEMRRWLEREIEDIHKASELRIKDATRLVTAYALGELTRDQAAAQSIEYSDRWGDALPGVLNSKGVADNEILATIDQTRQNTFASRANATRSHKWRS